MFSSGKFLSPIAIAGLPTPGPEPAEDPFDVDVVALELVEDEPLLPHAASARLNANAPTTLVILVLDLLHRLTLIRRLRL